MAHLVRPNKIHHLFSGGMAGGLAGREALGPASTIAKRGGLSFQPALEDSPPPDWGGDIDQAWFCGSFMMDEVVFFHRP